MCVLDLTACQVAEQLMTIAYESGVNLFDTAEVYAGGRWVIHRPVFLCVMGCRCPVSLSPKCSYYNIL